MTIDVSGRAVQVAIRHQSLGFAHDECRKKRQTRSLGLCYSNNTSVEHDAFRD